MTFFQIDSSDRDASKCKLESGFTSADMDPVPHDVSPTPPPLCTFAHGGGGGRGGGVN